MRSSFTDSPVFSAAMLAIISRLRRVDSIKGLMKATFMGPRAVD